MFTKYKTILRKKREKSKALELEEGNREKPQKKQRKDRNGMENREDTQKKTLFP